MPFTRQLSFCVALQQCGVDDKAWGTCWYCQDGLQPQNEEVQRYLDSNGVRSEEHLTPDTKQ